MTAPLRFVVLDDVNHVIGFEEHTVCGLPIPMTTYTTDQPKKLCPECKAGIKDTDEFGVLQTAP